VVFAGDHRVRVSVCVATYRRPQGLARLLAGLDRATFELHPPSELEVVVVDNDAERSAEALCREVGGRFRWRLEYVVETRRGIAHARNRAIQRASPLADFIAFVDDDEVPAPSWLDELLRAQATCRADVVFGPVLPYFETDVPPWILEGRFFERRRYPTGHRLEYGGAGNSLISAPLLRERGFRFDERLGLTGGEDTLMFRRMSRAGYTMVWADRAIVHEWIPPSRATARWVLQRAYRLGTTWSFCERDLDPSISHVLARTVRGLGRVALGASLLLPGTLRGRQGVLKSAREVCFGLGSLAGIGGLRYEEYRRTHGD
jgi:succinoglycan biosynthesis protein ExoM